MGAGSLVCAAIPFTRRPDWRQRCSREGLAERTQHRAHRTALSISSSAAPKAWSVLSNTWTPRAVASEGRIAQRRLWRAVEAQHIASTLRLVDTVEEQMLLERILEGSKPPPIPLAAANLHSSPGNTVSLFLPHRLSVPRARRYGCVVRGGETAHCMRGGGLLALALPDG